MAVLDSWHYLNPETVAIRREEEEARKLAACGNCVHRLTGTVNGKTLDACEYGRHFGKRCEAYRVRKL